MTNIHQTSGYSDSHLIQPSAARLAHPLVFIVFEHADAMLDDEEEVDAGQRSETLPDPIEGCDQIGIVAASMLAVVVLSLRLKRGGAKKPLSAVIKTI